MKSVVIIGGGVAGLTTAYRLKQWGGNAVEYRVVESLPRLGGKITSAYQDGFLIEGGPDSFNTQKTAALELCRCLGLEGQLLGLKSASPKAHVWSKGRLRPMPDAMSLVPTRIVPFLKSSLVSWPGKLRM